MGGVSEIHFALVHSAGVWLMENFRPFCRRRRLIALGALYKFLKAPKSLNFKRRHEKLRKNVTPTNQPTPTEQPLALR